MSEPSQIVGNSALRQQSSPHVRSAILFSLSFVLLSQIFLMRGFPANAADGDNEFLVIPLRVKHAPKLRIQKLPDQAGYDINYSEPGVASTSNFYGLLIAVDGVPVAGKSYSEIQNLLQAKTDSDVRITFLRRDDTPYTASLKRTRNLYSPDQLDVEKNWLTIQTTVFEDESMFDIPLQLIREKIDSFAVKNVELCAKAAVREVASTVEAMPYEAPEFKYNLLVQTVIDSDTIGDTAFADECIKRLIDSGEFYITHSRPYYQEEGDILIKHLFDSNRHKQCKIFCKRLFEWCEKQSEEMLRTRNLYSTKRLALRAYAQILADENSPEALKTVEDIIKLDVEISQAFDEDKYGWLGDFYSQLKLYDRALDAYEKLGVLDALTSSKTNMPIGNVRLFEQFAMKQAALHEKLNRRDTAIETLTDAIEGYKTQLNDEKQNLVEQLGSFYPSIRDVEIELANVYLRAGKLDDAKKTAQTVVARTEKILGPKSSKLIDALTVLSMVHKLQGNADESQHLQLRLSELKPTSDSDIPVSTKFDLLRTTYSAIDANNRDAYLQSIAELLHIYSTEAPAETVSYVTNLNLFCALTSVSRKLADHHQVEDANNLIDKLISLAEENETMPTCVPLLKAEKALNAEIGGIHSAALWAVVDDQVCCAMTAVHKRALQGRSEGLKDRLRTRARLENLRRLGMLYINSGEIQRAEIVLNRALSFSSKLDIDDSFPEINPLSENTLLFIELAFIKSMKGNSDSSDELLKDSLNALEKALDRDTQYKDQYKKTVRFRATRLADQLFKSGRPRQAINYLLQVNSKLSPELDLSDTHNLPPGVQRDELCSRAALHAYLSKLLLLQGQEKSASIYMAQAIAERQDDVPFRFWILGSEIASRQKHYGLAAHYLSESAKTFDVLHFKFKSKEYRQELLAKAYVYANQSKDLDESEKLNIALRLAERSEFGDESKQSLKLYKQIYKRLPDKEKRKADLATRIANMELSNSESQSERPGEDKDKSAAERLRGLKRAAAIAERTRRPDANMFWTRLACAQLEANKLDDALDSYRHNFRIKQYPRYGVPPNFFVSNLIQRKLFKEAETVLNEQLGNSISAYGLESFSTAHAMAQLTSFHLDRGHDEEALKTLDKLLSLDLRKLEATVTSAPSAVSMIYTSAAALPDNRSELALVVLKKLLDRQRQFFGEDERVAATLVQIGKANAAAQNYLEAYKNALSAIAIKKLYVGEYLAEVELMRDVVSALLGMDKEAEAKQFQTTHQSQWNKEAAEPRPDRPNQSSYSNAPSAAQQKKLMLLELSSARAQAPYSWRTINVLESMIGLAKSEKDWTLLLEAASQRASIFEHYVDTYAGRTHGCLIPSLQRADYYALAAEAEIAMNNPEGAAKWIRRATTSLVELSNHECLKLARQAVKCHDNTQATILAAKAEDLFSDQPYFLGDVSKVWQDIGETDRADRLAKRAAKLTAAEQQARQQQNKDPFNGVQL